MYRVVDRLKAVNSLGTAFPNGLIAVHAQGVSIIWRLVREFLVGLFQCSIQL